MTNKALSVRETEGWMLDIKRGEVYNVAANQSRSRCMNTSPDDVQLGYNLVNFTSVLQKLDEQKRLAQI